MYIKEIELTNFRNLSDVKATLNKGLNVLSGGNGQGKTNFLESIYLSLKGRSFRKCSRDEIISYGNDSGSVKISLSNGIDEEIRAVIERDQKTVFLNGKIIRSYHREVRMKCLLLNSDTLFYFKNLPRHRLRIIDGFCYHMFGGNFLDLYRRMKRAFFQLRKTTPDNQSFSTWKKIALSYRSQVNELRKQFFQEVKKEYETIRDRTGLGEIMISFHGNDRQEISFLRRDRKDLSLGELKTVVFSLYVAAIRKIGTGEIIFLVDDFNAEWDNIMFSNAMELLKTSAFQSIVMCLDRGKDIADYSVEKGVIRVYG